jgi:acetolactate synthase-1/2/3 large subunit
MAKSGAKLLVEALKKEGVKTLFGYPGGKVIPIFDELFGDEDIHVVLTRHEQGAVHAADGFARSTGQTGVCVTTSGPGATNTITGLATANFDSVPIVCITGQVARNMIGNDAFQEADMVGVSRPVTKHNYLVSDRKHLGRILKEAFYIANSGRPGPVVIDIPIDVINGEEKDHYPESVAIRGYNPTYKGHPGQIKRAAKALASAQRPLFFIGGGVNISGAAEEFRRIMDKTDVPMVTSLMGLGIIPRSHPRNLGMLGMHGTYAANMAVTDSDLIFGIGVRFDDRATGNLKRFAPHAKIVHVDIDTGSISRNVQVEIPIVGDAKLILDDLLPLLEKPSIDPWKARTEAWQKENPVEEEATEDGIRPSAVLEGINDVFPDAIVSSEVGQNQMWAALFYEFKNQRTWLTSGGLGTMGYGFPAALGAQAGNPDRRVIDIAGDGSIQMNIQELATAVQEELPVIVAVLNNGYLGMVRQWQELFFRRRYSSTCLRVRKNCPEGCTGDGKDCPIYTPDFVRLAEAYGAVGLRVESEDEIRSALEQASAVTDRPIVIDFIIAREANVWPMVPPGAGIDEMLLGKGK